MPHFLNKKACRFALLFRALLFLFKNPTYSIRQAIFIPFYFALQIRLDKFSGSNSTEKVNISHPGTEGISEDY